MSASTVTVPGNAITPIGSCAVFSAVPIGQIQISYQTSSASALQLQYVRDGSTIQSNALSTAPNGTITDSTQLAANSNHVITVNAVNSTALPVSGSFNISVATQSV
ncbi:MAG: hypothetical protein ACHQ03_04675 [Candidatus Bathyarchaeia archaeon]